MSATLLAEVSAIMNARPLAPISTDPNSSDLLTPATILTQKVGVLSPPPGDFEKGSLPPEMETSSTTC